jgi:alkylhydroperoxidase family enzyme
VFEDWRTAPVRPQVRAALGFLEALVRAPDTLTPDHVRAVYATGVSRDGLVRAVHICVAFSTIVRVADTFNFELQSPAQLGGSAGMLLKRGYILP